MIIEILCAYAPLFGAYGCAVLAVLALRTMDTRACRRALSTTILITSVSAALYWASFEYTLPAHFAVWGLKIKAALAATGLVVWSRLPNLSVRPLLYSLLSLSCAVGTLTVVARLAT